ncbi:MAG: urease accessory UreF family protein [Pseudomonadota bacterium]
MHQSLAALRLCQLVSPALPIGAYNFSQGLEYAVDQGWLSDETSCHAWISGLAEHAVGTLDIPLLLRLHQAWCDGDQATVQVWSQRLIAARETAELRAEERHLGRSLAKVLVELQIDAAAQWLQRDDASYAALFALAAAHGGIDAITMSQGYLWAWAENQTLAAVKLLPLGQSAGQRVLDRLLLGIPAIVERALTLQDEDIGVSSPLQAMASAWHETQYSRLFRS